MSASTLTNRTDGARSPARRAARSALRWQSQSSSSSRPAARAASNSAPGVSSAVPIGPRASASKPTGALGDEVDDGLEADVDRCRGRARRPIALARRRRRRSGIGADGRRHRVGTGAGAGGGHPATSTSSTVPRGFDTHEHRPVRGPRPVRHVVLNRPEKRNALNAEVIAALHEAFADAAADRDVTCVVVRGAGPMFSSGMDFAALGGARRRSGRAARAAPPDPRGVEPARGDAEADDRPDPRRVPRRRDGARPRLRPARRWRPTRSWACRRRGSG